MNLHLMATHKRTEKAGFDKLKPQIQEQIKHLLLVDFRAAKALYDKHLNPSVR